MWLADFMAQEGLSDRRMGAKVGVHRTTVGKYRTGKLFPSPDMQERFAAVSGHRVTVSDWFAQRRAQRSTVDGHQTNV